MWAAADPTLPPPEANSKYEALAPVLDGSLPVIIDSPYVGPTDPEDGYDAPWRNVAALAKAGRHALLFLGR